MDDEDRRQAERSGEARYRLLVDAISDYAISMLDADGVVTSWNAGARRFKGYAPDEIIGQHVSRLYGEEDRAAGLPELDLDAARDGRVEREGWRVRKDGSRFWAHVVIDPIRDPAGRLVGFAKVTRDLTERRRAEAALRRSEEQFRLLVQGVTDYAIFMLDPAGRVASWNVGAERIKGYRPEEIVGEHFSRFYTAEDRAASVPAAGLETARREGRWESEGWRVRKDGSRFWAQVVIDAIRDEAGAVIAFAKVTRDITERREAQRALDEARDSLFHAQKLEAIGQLTGGVAHDFNNLLTPIIGALDRARRRNAEDERLTRLLNAGLQSAERARVLVGRLLSFARRQHLEPRSVAVPELVRGMVELVGRSLGPAIAIELDLPSSLPAARVDPNQLELALLNLCVNARDAMPGGGRLRIAADAVEVGARGPAELQPGSYVRLTVADTGTGMDPETLRRAVEPFFTTKGLGKGTGLGLSMVHGLAAQSGGALLLDSAPGRGTTAAIYLPVGGPVAEGAPAEAAEASQQPRRLVILLVDDEELVRAAMAEMLAGLGHRVLTAGSGAAALVQLHAEPEVDLLITDHAMPGMTGVALVGEARRIRPGLPALLVTGYASLDPAAVADLPRIGKPFRERDLTAMIAAAMGDQKVTPVLRRAWYEAE
ncbi:MAG: PAS domain S-box protein [Dongiaceae bacterium]